MKNGEKYVFCTHDVQHGICHGGSRDVADVSHNQTVTNTESPHFVNVVFPTGGWRSPSPIKQKRLNQLKPSSPLPPFFSHTNPENYDLISRAL